MGEAAFTNGFIWSLLLQSDKTGLFFLQIKRNLFLSYKEKEMRLVAHFFFYVSVSVPVPVSPCNGGSGVAGSVIVTVIFCVSLVSPS